MTSVCSTPTALLKNAITFPPFEFRITRVIGLIETKKALLLQRMCTYATGKGHEKSRGLIACQFPAM
jgi:hypothetical protein